MSRSDPVVNVRMSPEMKERIESAADEDFRSMSEEIKYLLHYGLQVRDQYKEMERRAEDDVARRERLE